MSLCKPAASLPWLADSLLCSLVGLCSLVASSPTLLGSVFWILHPQFGFIGDKNVRFLWSKMPLDLSNRIKCRMPEASATVVGSHPLLACWFSTCNASCSICLFYFPLWCEWTPAHGAHTLPMCALFAFLSTVPAILAWDTLLP